MRAKFVLLLFSIFCIAEAQPVPRQTVGLITHSAGSLDNGYVLFSPMSYTTTFLIDKCGKLVHSWPSKYMPDLTVYLMEDGSILRPGMLNGKTVIERIDWDGNVVWHLNVDDSTHQLHHDIQPLPNGNILAIVNDVHPQSEAFALGRDTGFSSSVLTSEEIREYQPIGTDSAVIVWHWRAWDHVMQNHDSSMPGYFPDSSAHPELVNINYPSGIATTDWLHFNSVKYNAALDQVMLGCHAFSELWIIDHSTTTAEAASHAGGKYGKGGDLLYRWGNPEAYYRGTPADKKLFNQHDPNWIPETYPHAGQILVFNNDRVERGMRFSSIDIVDPPVNASGMYDSRQLPFLPRDQSWSYTDTSTDKLFSTGGSGAQMLPNGNVLICSSTQGAFIEVDSNHHVVWQYANPVNSTGPVSQGTKALGTGVFRCTYYPATYAAFAVHPAVAGEPIEKDPVHYDCTLDVVSSVKETVPGESGLLFVFPNPAKDYITVAGGTIQERIVLFDYLGQIVVQGTNIDVLNTSTVPGGVYHLVVTNQGKTQAKMIRVVK